MNQSFSKIWILIILIILIIGAISVWQYLKPPKGEGGEISKGGAINIASQTQEAKEFLKLYPNTIVEAGFGVPMTIGAESKWTVSYTLPQKENDLNVLVTYLNIMIDRFGKIDQINPSLEIIKNEKRCNYDGQCYGINYPNKVDCVNFIYAWRIQKDLDTQALFHCSEENAICRSDVPCRCINKKCELE